MSAIATIAKRTAAGLAAAGVAAGIALGAAQSAAATTLPPITKTHDVYGSVNEHCHQNNFFSKADTYKNQPFYTLLSKGQFGYRDADLDPLFAGFIVCGIDLEFSEKDATGTLRVDADAAVQWTDLAGRHYYPAGFPLDIGPNQTRVFSITAATPGGDYDSATIQITNTVSN